MVKRLPRINALFVSHLDNDHVNGLDLPLGRVCADTVFIPHVSVATAFETLGRRCYLPGMADTAFDNLAMTRQLKAKGFSSDQAEAITEAVRAGVTGGVATKADVAELRGSIAEIRNDLLWMKRIGGVIVVLLAVPILRDLLSALN